jgi:hypothetical protein
VVRSFHHGNIHQLQPKFRPFGHPGRSYHTAEIMSRVRPALPLPRSGRFMA